jgi:hypothetical protein
MEGEVAMATRDEGAAPGDGEARALDPERLEALLRHVRGAVEGVERGERLTDEDVRRMRYLRWVGEHDLPALRAAWERLVRDERRADGEDKGPCG